MKIRTAAIGVVLAVGIVACGGDDDSGTATSAAGGSDPTVQVGPSDETAPSGSDATANTGSAPSADESDPDGTFRWAYFYEPSRFDPHRAANSGDGTALFLTYDRLIHLSAESEPIPGLAESWEYSDDGLALTLSLREGVTFHDGEPFDAEAVKLNIERAKTLEGSVAAADLAAITSVDVVDDLTVVINLSEPQASLLALLSDRHGAMISPAAFDNPDLEKAPVGTGMYRMVEYRPGDRIIYERYEDYWDPEVVGAARFEYVLIGDAATRLNALRSGEVDAASLETSQIEQAESAGLTINTRTTLSYQSMYMNRAREPFDDANVRRALNYAVDRAAIVEALEFGHGQVSSQIFPEGYWAFNAEVGSDFYTYDPERARELLAEAGLADGFEFDMLVPVPGTPPALAEILKEQFAAVGVDAEIVQTPSQGVADLFFVQESSSAMLGFWGGRPDASMTTALRWTSEGFSNPGGHSTPEIEQLHEQAASILDPDERAAAMHELVALGTEEALDLVLFFPVSVQAGAETVAQMPTVALNGRVEFRGASVRAAS